MTDRRDPRLAAWEPQEHGAATPPLERSVTRGLSWTILDNWGRQLLGFAVFVILANLLAPVDFGLVALAVVFVNFAQVFVDQGLGDAIIQRADLRRSQIDTAFWVAVGTGTLLTAAGVGLAIPIATLLGEPDLQPILQVLSLAFVLTAMSSIQIALLRRELAFRSLALRSLFAMLAGGAVGIGMALLDYGPWALVGQQLASAGAAALTLWWVLPWRPSLTFSRRDFRSLFTFGINVVGTDSVAFFARNSDNLLIGAFLGTTPLGLYAVGYRMLDTTQVLLINISRKIAFPALASLQQDPARITRAYFKLTRVSAALVLPTYVGLALAAPEIVLLLLGDRWSESGPVASVLFLIGPVLALQAFSSALFYAVGKPSVNFRLRLITMVVRVAGFFAAVPFGIVAVAAAFSVSGYVLLPLNLYWQHVHAGIPIRQYVRQLRGPAFATVAMAVAVVAAKAVLADVSEPEVVLSVEIALGAVAYLVALVLLDRRLVAEVLSIILQVIPGGSGLRRRFSRIPTGSPR